MSALQPQSPAPTGLPAGPEEGPRDLCQGFFDTLTLGALILEADGTISRVNRAMLRLLGRGRRELEGRPYREVDWGARTERGESLPAARHPPCQALASGRRVAGVVMGLTAPGQEQVRWLRVSAVPQRDPGEKSIKRVYALFEDITRARIREEALISTDQRLSKILDSTHLGMHLYELRPEDRLVLVGANPASEHILGQDRHSLLGRDLEEAFPALTRTELPRRYREIALGGVAWQSEHLIPRQGLPPSAVEARAFQVAPGTLAVTFCDISERVRTRLALKESQAKLEAIVSSVSEVMLMMDSELKVTWANREAARLLGPCLEGRRCHDILQGRGEPCRGCPARLALSQGGVHEREISYLDQEGIRRELWGRASVVGRDPEGHPHTVLLVYREVTELKALQAEAMHTGHLAALGELAAGVAHEINNPVSGIINCAELLLRGESLNVSPRELAGMIIREGERIADIVHSLLSFARHSPEETEPLDLAQVLEESLSLLRARLAKDGVDLVLQGEQSLPPVAGRRNQIQQVFLNLLSNARYALNHKFGSGGRGKILRVSLGLTNQGEGNRVRIGFHDNGMGIPASVMDKVFDPFFSTKPVGEGTGLGLSISHGIINNLGGQLWLRSEEGQFTEVTVELPVWRIESGAGRDTDS